MTGLGTLEPLARAGFLVKGVLYLVIGTLAIQVAARAGGRVTGTRGALLTVLGQPFGRMLLLAAAIGLFGYAAWRIVQGVLDPERYGRGWKGIAMRIGFVARGVMHAALGWQALRLHRGLSASGGAAERTVARELLAWPYGDWVLVARRARPDRASPSSRSTPASPAGSSAGSTSASCGATPAHGRSTSAASASRPAPSSSSSSAGAPWWPAGRATRPR